MEITCESIKILIEGKGKLPCRAKRGDAGFDLYVSREAQIPPGRFVDIHTDVSIQMPHGVWGRITGRSSTLRTRNLLVSEGIIDQGYRGELFTGVYNLGTDYAHVYPGERLAQIIFHPIVTPYGWDFTSQLDGSDRGAAGFGSSGR